MRSSKKGHYMKRAGILLLVAALIGGMMGCVGPDDPEIRDWHDLDAIRDNLGGSYILMNDLDATTAGYTELASATANGGKGWEPIGTGLFDESDPEEPYIRLDPFTGTFDGQGYEIRHLFINRPEEHAVGLFGVVDEGGIIKNVGVANAAVTGGFGVGGLAGANVYGGAVSNSSWTGRVTGDMFVGGLVGGNGYEGTVSNCCASGSVSGNMFVGGLVGGNGYGGTVSNCYATGSVTGESVVGGLVAVNYEATVSNSYSTASVIGDADVGGLVGWNELGTVSSSFWDVETSGMEGSDGGAGKTREEMWDIATFTDAAWDIIAIAFGEINEAYTWNIVDGQMYPFLSWEEPMEIRTWHDLHTVRDNLAGSYIMMNDLDSTTAGYDELASPTGNEGKGWQPIGAPDDPFTGTFDGQGYEIRNPFINRPDEDRVGLFGFVDEGGRIEDIGVVNADATGNRCVGGLVGRNWGTVSNSYSTGSVTGEGYVGGLVGAGGPGTVSNSYSAGNVTGYFYVGGLVGASGPGTVSNSYSTGSVIGHQYVGGLVGANWDGTVSNSHSTGSVTGEEGVGGLAGANADTVSNSYSTGSVTGEQGVGGLVGVNVFGSVSNSYATGSVTGEQGVGGLVGVNGEGTVSNSYSTGSVTGNDYVGGLVGVDGEGTVSNSYSTGSVTGNDYVGGLVGANEETTVSNSYSTGSVTGNDHVGGLVGANLDGTVSGSFWDTETSGQATSDGGTGKTTAEMQDITTFTDTETEGLDEAWDMTAVAPGVTNTAYTWNIVDGETYPFLGWQSVS